MNFHTSMKKIESRDRQVTVMKLRKEDTSDGALWLRGLMNADLKSSTKCSRAEHYKGPFVTRDQWGKS